MVIMTNLLNDLKEIMITNVENIERKTGITILIDKNDPDKLLKDYLTLMLKLIVSMIPRTVLISAELKDKIDNQLIPNEFILVVNEIKEKFENGKDLNPFLSKDAFQPKKQDGLLFDWGIKHLHLSTGISSQGYLNKRTGYQLIFFLKDDKVYFIDVFEHPKGDEWAKDDFIKILEKNWQSLLNDSRMSYFSKTTPMTQKDRYDARNGGLLIFAEANGSVYSPPGGGIASDKSSVESTNQKIKILTLIGDSATIETKIKEEITNENKAIPSTLTLELILSDSMISILEKNTGVILKSNIGLLDYN